MVLAGGRGSRLGGFEKGEIQVQGRRLIDIVIDGAESTGCEKIVIAGDISATGALTVREQPAFGGPVAGLAAAMPQIETDWIMLLACDLPHARLLCHLIAESFHSITPEFDGLAALTDFRIQWLAGIYRRSSIESALERLGDPRNAALRDLFGDLRIREVQDPEGLAHDVDTPEELAALTKTGGDR